LKDSTTGNRSNKVGLQTEAGEYCFLNTFESVIYKDADVKVEKKYEILLGETKYYAVKKKTETGELKIEEIKTDYGDEPQFPADADGWEWQKTDVWGTDPIEKLGTKSGVYWEKKWFDKTDNKNKDFTDDNIGMIRVIGRYWEEGKEENFKVKLKTGNNTEIKIKTIKPEKLLTEEQLDSYSKSKDVFDKEYSIDSLCIVYGGKYGIPPQMLKGQIYTESAKKDFGGTVGNGFAPSYRYEPYTTQFDKVLKSILKSDTNPFIVTETAMGKPGSAPVPTPLDHRHVLFNHYFQSPGKTVWEIIEENSSLVDVNNTSTTYGFQYKGTGKDSLKKGQLKSGVYSIVTDTYLHYLKGPKDKETGKRNGGYEDIIKNKYGLKPNESLSYAHQIEANDLARIATIDFLMNKFNGGLTNSIAQTRIASSYGLLQILYTTAYDEHNYPITNNDRPENLNEIKLAMDYAVEHLKKLFSDWNKFSLEVDNNWSSKYSGQLNSKYAIFPKPTAGFEQALSVMHYKWNPGEQENGYAIYHKKVLNNSKRFLPRSK
jgi:hypothetical protein